VIVTLILIVESKLLDYILVTNEALNERRRKKKGGCGGESGLRENL